ncbi:MAG: phage holin family protein [Actinobacteria bacterium]|nr:phage holin family protein [Actinomycetota bacterium]
MAQKRTDDRFDWPIRLVLGWGTNLLALWLASRLIGSVGYRDFAALAIAAAVLAIVNLVVKPILTAVSCLLIIATLGVALFLINMAMVALTAWLVPGFAVGGFWSVAGAALIVWAANVLVQAAAQRTRKKRKPLT